MTRGKGGKNDRTQEWETWSLPYLFWMLVVKFHPFPKIWLLPKKDDMGIMAMAQGMAVLTPACDSPGLCCE